MDDKCDLILSLSLFLIFCLFLVFAHILVHLVMRSKRCFLCVFSIVKWCFFFNVCDMYWYSYSHIVHIYTYVLKFEDIVLEAFVSPDHSHTLSLHVCMKLLWKQIEMCCRLSWSIKQLFLLSGFDMISNYDLRDFPLTCTSTYIRVVLNTQTSQNVNSNKIFVLRIQG